ncbi:MAG: hypothetical protein LBG21_00065 [Campylobacteraceae bacterium]|jgi:hypothetical protein|nr:hypothetical protein [Campylobacteraceae bacterium]
MKTFKYKKWLCKWDKKEQTYVLFTPEEMEQPAWFRYPEFECATAEQCKEFIDSY